MRAPFGSIASVLRIGALATATSPCLRGNLCGIDTKSTVWSLRNPSCWMGRNQSSQRYATRIWKVPGSSIGCGRHHSRPWPTDGQMLVGSCFRCQDGRSHQQVRSDGHGSGHAYGHSLSPSDSTSISAHMDVRPDATQLVDVPQMPLGAIPCTYHAPQTSLATDSGLGLGVSGQPDASMRPEPPDLQSKSDLCMQFSGFSQTLISYKGEEFSRLSRLVFEM